MQASDFSDVFVSYRRKDVEFTKQLVAALQKEGKECWIDWEDIPPGSEGFTDDIKRGLEGADAFLAILSPDYLDSTYCVDMELGTAIKLNKKIIPLVLKKFDDKPIPHGIGHINWIYFTPHAGHDNTFAESFPKVLDALNLDLAHARAHKNFALRALDWDTHKRHPSRLLKGQELDVAEDWLGNAAGKTPEPTELHREYILTGRKFANLQQRRVLAGVSFALIVSVILAIASLIGFQRATAAEAEARTAEAAAHRSAEVSSSLALASAALQPGNEEISIALALEATRIENPPTEVLVSLMQAAYPPGKRDVGNISYDGWLTVFGTDVSPDGQFIAINNALYDLATVAKVREFPDAPKVSVVTQFLPDGKRVIIAGDESSEEKSIHAGLFDIETGALLHEFVTEFGVGKLWLSADGSKIATENYMARSEGEYGMVLAGFTIFDVATGEALQTVETKSNAIALNADLTQWVEVILPEATETTAGTTFVRIVVRSVATNEVITTASAADDTGYNAVDDLAFHPDGTRLAVIANGVMHVYDTETGAALNAPRVHAPDMLSYSPDGRYLLIGTIFESQIALWDTTSDNPPIILSGHTDSLLAVEFAGSSDLAVSLDITGTLIKWDLNSGIEEYAFPGVSAWLNNTANEFITISGFYNDSPELVHYSLATYEELSRVSLPENISDPIFSADFSQFISQVRDENSGSTNHFILVDTQTGAIVQKITTEQTIPESFYYARYQFVPGRQQAILLIDESKWDDATQTNMSRREWLLWDLATGSIQPYAPLNNLSLEAIDSWTFHPEGQWLYITIPITDKDDRVQYVVTRYDFATGEELSRFDPDAHIDMFIDDGASFISTEYPQESDSSVVTLRDSQTGVLQQSLINQLDRGVGSLLLLDLQSNRAVIAFASGGGGGGPISPSLSFGTGGSESGFYILDTATGEILWDFGDPEYSVSIIGFNADNSAFIAAEDKITLYRNDTLDSLIAWTCANRYVPELTEEQQARYRITSTDSVCQ
jgi:WD40 repeat protein